MHLQRRWSGLLLTTTVLFASAAVFAGEAADDFRKQGIEAIKLAQSNPNQIVPAARFFAQAATQYEIEGNEDLASEMNSYLYWCKKKMNLEQINAFVDSGETAVADRLNRVSTIEVKPDDAEAWMQRADTFSQANPDQHLLVAIRYFEVADRFKGSEISLKAQDLSLQAQQRIAAGGVPRPRAAVREPAVEPKRGPVPDAAQLKEAEKTLKEIFKDEYANTKPDGRRSLAQQLLRNAREHGDDLSAKYVQLRDARDFAQAAGDVDTALTAIDALAASFDINASAEKSTLLSRLSDTARTPEAAKLVTEQALKAAQGAFEQDQFDALRTLSTTADKMVVKTGIPPLVIQVKDKTAQYLAICNEWKTLQPSLEKLKNSPEDAAANTAVGRFYCLQKGEWERGLGAMARGSDLVLKPLAEKELLLPTEAAAQVALADGWWEVAQKSAGVVKTSLLMRAKHWYSNAITGLTGLEKTRVEKRAAEATKLINAQFKYVNEFTVEALVDGDSSLCITPTGIYWEIRGGPAAKPGLWRDANEATSVNGVRWMPKWGQPDQRKGPDKTEPFYLNLGPTDFSFEVESISPDRNKKGMDPRDTPEMRTTRNEQSLFIRDSQDGARWYKIKFFRK